MMNFLMEEVVRVRKLVYDKERFREKEKKQMTNVKSELRETSKSKILLYPLLIVMAIIPLIVHQKTYPTHLEQYSWYSYAETAYDFFLYYKSVWLAIMAALMLVILCWKMAKEKEYRKIPMFMIPAGIYGLFIIISMIFSKDRSISLHGIVEQFEPGTVLIGYLIFMYYAYLIVNTENDVKFLMKVWVISIAILCILGLLQVLGHDFFATDFGKKLIATSETWQNLEFNFGKNRIYLTLYNPNYVGVYATLALPILGTLLLFTKNIKWKVIYAILMVGMVICIIGSQSKTAFGSLAVVVIFAVIFFRKLIKQYWKFLIPIIIAIGIVFFVFDASIGHEYTNSIKSAISTITNKEENTPIITRVDTLDDEFIIDYMKKPLHISYTRDGDSFSISAKDDSGTVLDTIQDESGISIQDDRFQGIHLRPVYSEDMYLLQFSTDTGITWYFSNEIGKDKEGYYFYTPYGKWDKVNNPEIFDMKESLFSGRGYIWARTIPLLKDYIIKGSGPDTYTLVFPQDDYIGLENNGYRGSVVTKPHNLFLQIGIQTGVISLIAFLALYLIYFIQSIRLYVKNKFESYSAQIGVGIFLATIGYMIGGITNDSTITVSPIFWILLGIGFAMNQKIKEE